MVHMVNMNMGIDAPVLTRYRALEEAVCRVGMAMAASKAWGHSPSGFT